MADQETGSFGHQRDTRMFLYKQPEALTVEVHGRLGINPTDRPFDFVRNETAIPIAAAEIASVQRDYPVVFSDLEKPTLLAIVGVQDNVNLFVDRDGRWDRATYLPAYLRCYPFALAPRPDDQFAVVIDRAAGTISENADQPLFDGKQLAGPIKKHVDFCARFSSYRQATSKFCDRLLELGLLSGQQAKFTPDDGGDDQLISSYVAVDLSKLTDLDADTLRQLHLDGTLSGIYAHGFSMDNWTRLLERRKWCQSSG